MPMFRWRRIKINRIIRVFVYGDFLFYVGVGFMSPIIAVFYAEGVTGGSVALAGMATALFWVVKSAVQVPVSILCDRRKGELDDFLVMVVGFLVASVVPLAYYLLGTVEIWHVYLLEAIRGIGYGLSVPTFLSIYTRHIDHDRENIEWTLHSNAVGLGYAGAAAVGGTLAERYGFDSVFLLTFAVCLLGPITIMLVKRDIIESDRRNGHVSIRLDREKQLTHH